MRRISGLVWKSLVQPTIAPRRAQRFAFFAKSQENSPRLTYAVAAFFAGGAVGASVFLFGLADPSRKASLPVAKWKVQDDIPVVRRYADKPTTLMVKPTYKYTSHQESQQISGGAGNTQGIGRRSC